MDRVTIYRRSGYQDLVEGADVNDRGWKARFFFVNKQSLDLQLETSGGKDGSKEVIDSLYSSPVTARSFDKPLAPTTDSSSMDLVCITKKRKTASESSSHPAVSKPIITGSHAGGGLGGKPSLEKPTPSSVVGCPKIQFGDISFIFFPTDFLVAEGTDNGIWPFTESGVSELEDEMAYQEAKTTLKIKASMANKFLMGKFDGKKKDLQIMVDK
ncbi:Dihydroorotate dehydrogenase [Bienertia sinuspersici]